MVTCSLSLPPSERERGEGGEKDGRRERGRGREGVGKRGRERKGHRERAEGEREREEGGKLFYTQMSDRLDRFQIALGEFPTDLEASFLRCIVHL